MVMTSNNTCKILIEHFVILTIERNGINAFFRAEKYLYQVFLNEHNSF